MDHGAIVFWKLPGGPREGLELLGHGDYYEDDPMCCLDAALLDGEETLGDLPVGLWLLEYEERKTCEGCEIAYVSHRKLTSVELALVADGKAPWEAT